MLRASRRFGYSRKKDISEVIEHSGYLKQCCEVSVEKGIVKAIQSINRSPERDDPQLISGEELDALARVRPRLERDYWKLYEECDLRERIFDKFASKQQRKLRLCRQMRISREAGITTWAQRGVDYYFSVKRRINCGNSNSLEDSDRLRIFSFCCIEANYAALRSKSAEKIIPDEPRSTSFWRLKEKLTALFDDLCCISDHVSLEIIVDASELFQVAKILHPDCNFVEMKQRLTTWVNGLAMALDARILVHDWSCVERPPLPDAEDPQIQHLTQHDAAFLFKEAWFARAFADFSKSERWKLSLEIAASRVENYGLQGLFFLNTLADSPGVVILAESPAALKSAMLSVFAGRFRRLPVIWV